MRTDAWLTVGFLAITLGACGGGSLTASEYAETIEESVSAMEARFVEADTAWEAEEPSMEAALRYWDDRLDIREDFLEEIEGLDPPPEIAAMHEEALSVFRRITDADIALAGRVAEYDAITSHRQWLDTPEGQASLAVLEDVYAFCRASQEQMDATAERESLEGVPWLPPQLREVIKVAFGCPPAS